MKARMTKPRSIKTIIALALLIAPALALAAARDPVSGFGTVTGFVGSVTLMIGDDTFHGAVVVAPAAPPEFRPNGVIYFPAVEHVFSFGGGDSMTTIGMEVAVPTDEPGAYTLHGYMKITSGAGIFADASGDISVQGEIGNFQAGEASFEMHGAISR